LTNFGEYTSPRAEDDAEFKRIDKESGKWLEMQNEVVGFQSKQAKELYEAQNPRTSSMI
jgi:hypothetical protein